MKKISKALAAVALTATTVTAIAETADARTRRHHYYGSSTYRHKVCRRSHATTGTVVGGVAGAVAGPSIVGHGLLGAVVGGVGGAVAGGAIDRSMTAHRRCYYTR